MCNRTCDRVLFFLYAHLQNKLMITSATPPPPNTHTPYTLPPSVCPVVAKGALAAPPPSLEFEVQNNKSLCIIPIVLLKRHIFVHFCSLHPLPMNIIID